MGDLSELALGNQVVNVKDKTARNHISNGDIHVTSAQKTTWSNKYDKPGDGIPKSHLASAVQNLLTAAETALQPSDLTTLEEKVAALEAYFSSESDADNIINKWNEIVAFLSGIGEASTLSGLLSDISGQINEKVPLTITKSVSGSDTIYTFS